MGEVTKEIQDEIPWCMMLTVDDTVLVGKNLEKVNNIQVEWRLALGGRELRISRSKTEHIE